MFLFFFETIISSYKYRFVCNFERQSHFITRMPTFKWKLALFQSKEAIVGCEFIKIGNVVVFDYSP